MSIFLVGPNDETLFSKRTTWEFSEALQAANNGDTIEFVKDFSPYYGKGPKQIIIEKDITLIGQLHETEEESIHTNVINQIFIKNGASVTLKNIHIKVNNEKENCLNIKDKASVTVENVFIENESTSNENYPLVHLSENSTCLFNRVIIPANANTDGNNILVVKDATLKISNSIIHLGVIGNNAELNFEHTDIHHPASHALYTNNQSIIHLTSVYITGGKVTNDTIWACVKLDDSKGSFQDVLIEQPNFHSALRLVNSSFTIDECEVDSFFSLSSNVTINHTQILESFTARNHSAINSTGFDILGRENRRINLFADNHSSFQVDTINFGKESYPNIKLEHNVAFDVGQVNFLAYDPNNENFQTDENGQLIALNKEVEIDFFGEKSSLQRLDELIGIESVKSEVEEFVAFAQMNLLREEQGLKGSVMSLHSMFLGNPGTGKTTVARIIGDLLYEKNVISNKVFIEVSRSDLVGNYIGHTATQTREVLESALGGVLFIDEAYTLNSGGSNDFGIESINEILSFMENHRNDLVIIFAGYTNDMNKFLETNDGLKSRIPNIFDFPDYTIDELIQIGLIDIHGQNYQINEEAYRELVYNNYDHSYDNSNGRWVRNLNERIIRKMALRIMRTENPDVTKILDEDMYSLMI